MKKQLSWLLVLALVVSLFSCLSVGVLAEGMTPPPEAPMGDPGMPGDPNAPAPEMDAPEEASAALTIYAQTGDAEPVLIKVYSADDLEALADTKEDGYGYVYYKGDANLNAGRVIAVVGTRNVTDYGKANCQQLVSDLAEEEVQDNWNLIGLKDYFYGWLLEDGELVFSEEELPKQTKTGITDFLINKMKTKYAEKEQNYGEKIIRELERVVMLRVVDNKWMAHIDDMQELKRGISLRSYGQKNPVVEYRYEGFEMFDAMVDSIREETVRMLLTIQIQQQAPPPRQQVLKPYAPNAGSPEAKNNQ